jgi:hypothetical protein
VDKKFLISWLVLFVCWMAGSFVVHGVLLHADYSALRNLFRSPEDSQVFLPLMIVAHVFLSGALVWIYSRGVEAKPWLAQGLRFGLAVASLTVFPMYIIYYVVQPMPGATVVKQLIFDGVLTVLLGVVVAFLYRPRAG